MIDVDMGELRAAVAHLRFGDVSWVEEIDSTNRQLLDDARAGAPQGRVMVADHQTAGRGRRARAWEDPPGSSLLVSFLFRPDGVLTPADGHLATMAVSLAAAEACGEVAAVPVSLKWPNDLVVEPADADPVEGYLKVAGVLGEAVVSGSAFDALVVGCGLNVNWPVSVPAELTRRGQAVNRLAGEDVDRAELLCAWLRRLDGWWARVESGDRAELLRAYRARTSTLGRAVRVETADDAVTGTAVDVDERGRLLVEAGDSTHRFDVAEVVHLRPAAG